MPFPYQGTTTLGASGKNIIEAQSFLGINKKLTKKLEINNFLNDNYFLAQFLIFDIFLRAATTFKSKEKEGKAGKRYLPPLHISSF
jgi:hypothetical protein